MSLDSSTSSRSSSTTPVKRSIPLPDSSGGSITKVSSPLNAASTPKATAAPLPAQNTSPSSPSEERKDVPSSTDPSSEPLRPLSMVLISAQGDPSSIVLPELDDHEEEARSTEQPGFVSRTRQDMNQIGFEVDSPKMSTSWWGEKHVSRPWHDTPKRKKTIPPEQSVALEDTRKRVAQAAASVLGTAADITHEALYLGVEFLDFVPIPGLQAAATTLLNIWDAAQDVDMNRLGCLRLTERCAEILLSVREEVHEGGDQIGSELHMPLAKLEDCFTDIYRFMFKQKTRPWLKRYLKRDEIRRDIGECHIELQDALALFGVSIQIRILKQVQKTEKRREQETHLLTAMLASRLFPDNPDGGMIIGPETEVTSMHHPHNPYVVSTEYSSETVAQFVTTKNALGIIDESPTPEDLESSKILPDLKAIHALQNSLDDANDITDLRQLMREALQTNSDAEILRVLQIGQQEMPDAIKTLQRALEWVSEREGEISDKSSGKDVVLGKITRRVSIKENEGSDQAIRRSETVISIDSSNSSANGSGSGSANSRVRDTLDREFIETGIDSLRRMSQGVEISVPTWTITKYEVDRGQMIGVGFFSTVYKGTWRDRIVAIKVLAEATPRKLFQREMGIWKTLHHANVLPLYGASSATGDPPWFFVTQYHRNGTLTEHLRRVEAEQRPYGLGLAFNIGPGNASALSTPRGPGTRATTLPAVSPWLGINIANGLSPTGSLTPPNTKNVKQLPRDTKVQREWDLFRFMHEISKGMDYLHSNGVLHGDLKASNVLVDDKYRCVISDFGQSEMKSEAFRISGTHPHGTLGWQSPELMSGRSRLTYQADVWAFSITCVEVMNMGKLPWSPMDDNSVRRYVLDENIRPPVPKYSRFNTPGFQEIIKACWQLEPNRRPSFSKVSRDFKLLRKSYADGFESPSPRIPVIEEMAEPLTSPSPDLRPVELPQFLRDATGVPPEDILSDPLNSDGSYTTISGPQSPDYPHQESTVATVGMKMPEPVLYTPGHSSRSSSILAAASRSDGRVQFHSSDGYESPPPIDEQMAQRRNERRYRFLLVHEHHPSLTLALWEPSPVELGAVGYLAKPEGKFITLFNSYEPHKSDHPGIRALPSVHGYGNVKDDIQRLPKKTAAQRALDMLIGSLAFRNSSEDIVRRPSFPLKAGHKAAYLYTETTEYRYMLTLNAPKRWLEHNVDAIMRIYGHQHRIQRDDLFLIIGTLKTPAYALLVSHNHPEGHARFNVYANPQIGKPWGTFTTDTDAPLGPSYLEDSEEEISRLSASKVSLHGGPMDAVLLARLRFKPDATEPTSR